MNATTKANRLTGRADRVFRKAHQQTVAAARLHEQASAEHAERAKALEAAAVDAWGSSAEAFAARASAENKAKKLAEFVS